MLAMPKPASGPARRSSTSSCARSVSSHSLARLCSLNAEDAKDAQRTQTNPFDFSASALSADPLRPLRSRIRPNTSDLSVKQFLRQQLERYPVRLNELDFFLSQPDVV